MQEHNTCHHSLNNWLACKVYMVYVLRLCNYAAVCLNRLDSETWDIVQNSGKAIDPVMHQISYVQCGE